MKSQVVFGISDYTELKRAVSDETALFSFIEMGAD